MVQMRESLKAFKEKKGNSPITVLEAGVCTGENAAFIYNTLNIVKMYLIDMYDPMYHKDVYDWAVKAYKKFENTQNVVFIKGNAIHCDELFKNQSLDYIYLDDNHSPKHVYEEIELYHSKVRQGGMIAGHDYDETKPNRVKKAVDEYFKGQKVYTDQNTLDWWVWI
jgi:predicted O-methyltransferase YrrM